MKIGITGYSGSLGKTLIKINKSNKIYRFKGDIRKKSDIKNWFKNKKIDAIFHLAAIVPIKIVKRYFLGGLRWLMRKKTKKTD